MASNTFNREDAALQAVQTIHEARIVHSDLKPANFLMVEGQLKLIDFGIAKAISSDTTSIARESQVSAQCAMPLFPLTILHAQVSNMQVLPLISFRE